MALNHRYCKVCKKVTLWYDDNYDKHGKYCTVCFND